VIQASQNDFEEFGVDQSTLDEMRQVSDSLAAAAPSSVSVMAAPRSHSLFLFYFVFLCHHRCSMVCAPVADGAVQPGWVVMGGRERG
jgi:transcription initiation factor TFIIA large subunit